MPCHAQLRWTFPFSSILILKEFWKNYLSRFMFNLSWILPRRSKTDRGCRTSEDEVQRSRKSLHSQTAVPRRPCHAPTRVLYHALKRSFHSGGQKRKKKKRSLMAVVWILRATVTYLLNGSTHVELPYTLTDANRVYIFQAIVPNASWVLSCGYHLRLPTSFPSPHYLLWYVKTVPPGVLPNP